MKEIKKTGEEMGSFWTIGILFLNLFLSIVPEPEAEQIETVTQWSHYPRVAEKTEQFWYEYEYDEAGQLLAVCYYDENDEMCERAEFTYDAEKRVKVKKYASPYYDLHTVEKYKYDAEGKLLSIEKYEAKNQQEPAEVENYFYNSKGRLSFVQTYRKGKQKEVIIMEYDDKDRLVTEYVERPEKPLQIRTFYEYLPDGTYRQWRYEDSHTYEWEEVCEYDKEGQLLSRYEFEPYHKYVVCSEKVTYSGATQQAERSPEEEEAFVEMLEERQQRKQISNGISDDSVAKASEKELEDGVVYDEKGRLVKRFNDDNCVTYSYAYLYGYDEMDNMLFSHYYFEDATGDERYLKYAEEYQYDKESNVISKSCYLKEDYLDYKETYTYDAQGRRSSETWESGVENFKTSKQYQYDEDGKKIKEHAYGCKDELVYYKLYNYGTSGSCTVSYYSANDEALFRVDVIEKGIPNIKRQRSLLYNRGIAKQTIGKRLKELVR